MAISTIELDDKYFVILPDVMSDAEAYGRWNALIAFDEYSTPLGWSRAHDGDFFPESYRDYVDEIRRRCSQGEFWEHPIRVDIDITQICNAKCTFCFSRIYQTEDYRRAWVRSTDLRKVISKCAKCGVKTVRYCGGGEPLVHPEIENILGFPREFGLKLTLITNGDLLNRRTCEKLVASVDNLHWSVNAATDQTRIKVHRPGPGANQLSESRRWIRWIVEEAKQRQNESPMLIWATYLLIPENIDEITTAARQMRDLGIKSVSFRPVYHGLHTKWTSEMIRKCQAALREVIEYADPPRFYIFTPSRISAVAANLNPNDFFSRCYSRELRTVLESTISSMQFQTCGLYRGNTETGHRFDPGIDNFCSIWKDFMSAPLPSQAPRDCRKCIDISINVTLSFINQMLLMNPCATFVRGWLEGGAEWTNAE